MFSAANHAVKLLVFCILVVSVGLVTEVRAQSITCDTPFYWGVNGHYYQRCGVGPPGVTFTYSFVEEFALNQRYDNLYGHLLTITSAAENSMLGPNNARTGYLAAFGDGSGWWWGSSPEAGNAVEFFGMFYDHSRQCYPAIRLYVEGGYYVAFGSQWDFRLPNSTPCGQQDAGFVVEYSEDTVPPVVHVTYPNGGNTDTLVMGTEMPVRSAMSDPFGA